MLALPQTLTQRQAGACLTMLQEGLRAETGHDVLLDATALDHFDSSALAVLLEFRRYGLAQGKSVLLRGLPARLRDLAKLYGVDPLLPVDAGTQPGQWQDAAASVA